MNRLSIVPIVILASSIAALAATAPEAKTAPSKQLQVYPKNLARHHVGANLFRFNSETQSFTPTEAAAAWLDDDITSGWSPVAGKQHYLIALSEPEVITNLSVSTDAPSGTVTIFAGDEPSAPNAKSWMPLARDIAIESINQKKLEKPFSRLAKYILLETNIAEPSPIYSLYLYGERPAVSFQLVKREQHLDTRAVFGPYVNELTALSAAGLYAGSRIAFATDSGSYTAWQKGIDDNAESGTAIIPASDQAGMILKFPASSPITKLAVLAGTKAKGKLEVFVVPSLPEAPTVAAAPAPAPEIQPVSNPAPAKAATDVSPIVPTVPLADLTPAATFLFDGTTPRLSQDLAGSEGSALLFRWTPEFAGEAFVLSELNAFNGNSLADYSLALTPDAIAELAADASKDGKTFADGKAVGDGKGGPLEPVGELFPRKPPYLPPALGFPPPLPPAFVVPLSE